MSTSPNNNNNITLLNCPFCGHQPSLYFQLDDLGDYKVLCDNCGASSCPHGIRYDESLAVIDWNTRIFRYSPNPTCQMERISKPGLCGKPATTQYIPKDGTPIFVCNLCSLSVIVNNGELKQITHPPTPIGE